MDWYILPLILSFAVTLLAQMAVSGAYRKYSRIRSAGGVTGARMARHMLDAARLYDVDILSAAGRLSDALVPAVHESTGRTSAVRRHFRPLSLTFSLLMGLLGAAKAEKV